MRRIGTALVLLAAAAVLATVSPAAPASAATISSVLSATPTVARVGDTLTVTASRLVDADGAPVTAGRVQIEYSPSPFTWVNQVGGYCPVYDVSNAPYSCQISLAHDTPGFYSAGLLYVPPMGTAHDIVVVGTVDFLVAPPLVGSTTTLAAPSPL